MGCIPEALRARRGRCTYEDYKRMPIIEEERIRGAPDLVVEILFPSTGYYDLRSKYRVYEKMWRVSSRPQQNATRHP